MAEEYTCIECEHLYDDSDGNIEKKICNKCLKSIKAYNNFLLETEMDKLRKSWWVRLGKTLKTI
jgi:hypothetical protein